LDQRSIQLQFTLGKTVVLSIPHYGRSNQILFFILQSHKWKGKIPDKIWTILLAILNEQGNYLYPPFFKDMTPSCIVANLQQWEIMSWHDMRCQKACKNAWRAFLICNHTIWWFCVVFMPLPTYPLFFHQLKSFK